MSKEIADRFRLMADRIEKNASEPFGGVALIIPPGESVSSVELLKLDPKPDSVIFWGEIRSKADEAVSELAAQSRQRGGFIR